MTTQEVANRLVELCRTGQYEQAQTELYADNAVSVEPASYPGPQTVEGLEAIKQKGRQFQSMIEQMYGGSVSDPIIAGNAIAFAIKLDAKMKGHDRGMMEELAVYDVKDGKIVKEQFFF